VLVAIFTLGRLSHTVVHRLEVINQSQDVSMADRNSLQDSDLVADHVLSPGHQSLVNDLGCIVSSSVDVDAFLDHRVGAST